MTTLKTIVSLVERVAKDEWKLESEIKEKWRNDSRMSTMDRVHTALEKFEAYVHRN